MPRSENFSTPLPKPRRRIWRHIVLGLVILLCGMIIGSGLTVHVIWKKMQFAVQEPEQFADMATQRLARKLDLTEEQKNQVREIVARHHGNLLHLREEVRPRITSELESIRRDIESVLTPDQVKEWNEIFIRVKKHWLPILPEKSAIQTAPVTPQSEKTE